MAIQVNMGALFDGQQQQCEKGEALTIEAQGYEAAPDTAITVEPDVPFLLET